MRRRALAASGAAALVALGAAACAGRTAPTVAGASAAAPGPRTRAERTNYLETSRYADVVAFVDALARLAPAVVRTFSMGATGEGRAIPVVVASRPAVATAEEARRLGRPVVYVQANIHAGEVEGKEALQALLRDLALAPGPNVLDSLVLVAVPIYNADGNERFADQSVNRTEQNGPALVGQRANAAGLDLNRDYVKAEAPETRAALALLNSWDPDAFVDLHTTDGSYHGYALTWSPSLHPSAPLAAYNQDTLLPLVAERVRARRGFLTFPYGNFTQGYGDDVSAANVRTGWYTYDHRARYGTNYYGLRGRLSVLSEAFSHDPFERRVRSTYAFVAEVLSALAEPGGRTHVAESRPMRPVSDRATYALRSRLTPSPRTEPVLAEDLAAAPGSAPTEPGVPRGLRRTGKVRAIRLPVYDRFAPVVSVELPTTGWAFAVDAPGAAQAAALLRRHGVRVTTVRGGDGYETGFFRVDSVVTAARPFQGHREVRLVGRWRTRECASSPSTSYYVVDRREPLALLAAALLEPESDDGLVTWNVWDAALRPGADFPVVRLTGDVPIKDERPPC